MITVYYRVVYVASLYIIYIHSQGSALVVLLHALTQFSGELRYAYNMIVAFHFQNNLIIVQVFSTVLHTDVCECVCV